MWILSCDGDLLDGKCIWLRPGSQHLLGRTTGRSSGDQLQSIDHKSISRKHLTITVEPLDSGASSKLHLRSKITLEDSSKSGTFVNGDRLSKTITSIDKPDNKVQLGSSNYIFHITWRPIVLTFTNLTSTQKKQDDPLAQYRALLEHADVKLVSTYISGLTTHVVATGRNNPACLQALAQAKWLVQYSWVATLAKLLEIESIEVTRTPLESDFVQAWPSETHALVPAGTEPIQQPDEMLLPDKRRAEVLSGLVFVFETEKQHDTLMPPITAAGGKTLLLAVTPSQTQPDTYSSSVRARFTSTKTAQATLSDMSQFVIVRAEPKDDKDWWAAFNEDVQGYLGRRCISQSEFLDAILTMDSRLLCQAVPVTNTLPPLHQQSVQAPSETQRSVKTRRYAAQSRFKGFDDFDPSQVVRVDSPSPEPLKQSEMDVDTTAEQPACRKRPAPAPNLDDVLDRQLGGLNEAKRQCLESSIAKTAGPTKRKDETVRLARNDVPDVKAKLAAQRKKQEEEERLRREEHLDRQLEGLTVEDLQQLVQIEEFTVNLSQQHSNTPINHHARPGWNATWTGRKNFKAFRPKGTARENGEDSRQQRVMVALQELPSKTDAFFDDYFLDRNADTVQADDASSANGTASQRQSNSLGLSSYGTSLGQRPAQISVQQLAGQKRPLSEQSTNGTVSKRPRRQQETITLDDDSDDELQFRRKRF